MFATNSPMESITLIFADRMVKKTIRKIKKPEDDSNLMNKIFTKYSSMSAPVKASLWFVFAVLFSVL